LTIWRRNFSGIVCKKALNEPMIGDVDLTPYQAGRRESQIPKAVIPKVQGMMDSLRFDGAFDPPDD
jgi:hypothetical protein